MQMPQVVLITAFVFASAILSEYVQLISDRGSFLASVWGRSKCDACSKNIPWYALIPIFGRLIAKSKCVHCGKKVSNKYFWFELVFTSFFAGMLILGPASIVTSAVNLSVLLFLYCATWLLMYEDARNYSVPVSWLVVWAISFGGSWYLFGERQVFLLDALLMAGVLILSLLVVVIRKPKEERDLSSLFGGADFIALGVFALFLGFEKTTLILILTLLSSGVFLLWQKRLKIGQRVPLLTVMLPWGLLALLIYAT